MVSPSKPRPRRKGSLQISPVVLLGIAVVTVGGIGLVFRSSSSSSSSFDETISTTNDNNNPLSPSLTSLRSQPKKKLGAQENDSNACPYMGLKDLTQEERFPVANKHRHMVSPPKGGKVHLICCQTTKGPWNILVHEKWSPLGAGRFVKMVQAGYFNLRVPLMRCIDDFLCQFGLNGPRSKEYGSTLKDETNWLPQGPAHRKNDLGVERFQKGYFAYAGSGKDSRTNQIFVALTNSQYLAGGSPWEVPWGELVGSHSYDTLDQIYTGYGEKGPSQPFLHNHDSTDPTLMENFPLLDYVNSCQVVDDEVQPE